MAYTILFFVNEGGRSEVKEFIDSLDARSKRKFLYARSLLEEFGFTLQLPHAKHVKAGIFELRFMGIEGHIRVFYFFFHQDTIVFTNGFVKKVQKLPKQEIEIALERRKIFMENTK